MKKEPSDTWYEDFFQGITCEIWEKAIPEETTLQEVDFLLRELNLQPGQRILDIPCGHGRHAVELAKRGFEVTGVDISETFIATLTKNISTENLSIDAIHADILSVSLHETFAAAICLGNSFGYFEFSKMKLFVKKVSAHLAPGARFIINSGMLAESILPNLLTYAKNKTYTIGEITMEVTNEYDTSESCLHSELLYTKAGKSEAHAFKHYVFTLGEIKRLLLSCGLRTTATYSATSSVEYKLGDPQIYLVAEKES